jgi:hypothetical protein
MQQEARHRWAASSATKTLPTSTTTIVETLEPIIIIIILHFSYH